MVIKKLGKHAKFKTIAKVYYVKTTNALTLLIRIIKIIYKLEMEMTALKIMIAIRDTV
jgi:hypothetical protein